MVNTMIYDQKTINILNNLIKKYPERFKDACNSLNDNQQKSKYWLVEKLNEYEGNWNGKDSKTGINVSVLTGWYGLLAYILIDEFKLQKINNVDSLDYDPMSKDVGRILFSQLDRENLKKGKATYVNYKIKDLRKPDSKYFKDIQLVTLTSCEHLEQSIIDHLLDKKILPGTLVVLQSNNYVDCNQHINTSKSLEEFSSLYDKFLDNKKTYLKSFLHYDRYMIIGIKK